jgi:hypothetical protein
MFMGKKVKLCRGIIVGIIISLTLFVTIKAQSTNNLLKKKNDSTILFIHNKLKNGNLSAETDSQFFRSPFIHRFNIENRPEYIFPTNLFLNGENNTKEPLRFSLSSHLKYSFLFYPNNYTDRIFGQPYQGIGLAQYAFGSPEELGNPLVFYLFQGARINQFNPFLSLNYEWNFGLSFGWKPYDSMYNPNNKIIGSKVNAYINTNVFLIWNLSRKLDLTTGFTLSHFSNGNTKFPNKGLNTTGGKVGLVYNFNNKNNSDKKNVLPAFPEFPQHISYELVLFGSGCRTGVDFKDGQIASPEMYEVFGFNFSPMYSISYRFRAGASIDGTYNGSANIYTHDFFAGQDQIFFTPPLKEQLALGLSARAEYIMPYFTIGIGFGRNVIHGGGDLDIYYQSLALKMDITRNSFLLMGYSLQNFNNPNFLMLGIGYRFNNKYPVFYR